ncbi:MAG: OmpA family protein [Owenweeksia sp.]|nr:OmpA family protein [Owenweeksia sp.]
MAIQTLRGPEDYNMELGRRRAEAVKTALVQTYGISEGRITVDAVGEGDPLAKPEANYNVNRRVDVVMQK